MARQVLHIHLDGFFVAVERARRPELVGQPIVIGGRADGAGRVAAVSAEAGAVGVCMGLPLREAATRCPGAHFLPGNLDAYGEVAEAADALVRRAFSRVEWVSLDEAYVDATDLRPDMGKLVTATEAIRAALRRELGLPAACGIGASKITARVASHLARPSGLLYVLPGYDARFLAPLAIDVLPGLPQSLRESLASCGVRLATLGDLACLSDDVINGLVSCEKTRGSEVTLWRRLASGDDDRVVLGSPVPRVVAVQTKLEGAFVGVDGLASRVQDLARDLASELGRRRLLARQLTVRATDVTDAMHNGTVILTMATSSATALAAAAATALRRALGWPRSVTALSVRASSLCAWDAQPPLFPARDVKPQRAPRTRVARSLRDLERILLVAGDRPLTRRAS